jgi:predicted ATPase
MADERTRIERLQITGFKSIRQADLALGSLNVLIGANGAGKSNLVTLFAFLKDSLHGRLTEHVGRFGGPDAFLHLGAKTTEQIEIALTVSTELGRGTLYQRVEFQSPDDLVYGKIHRGSSHEPSEVEEMSFTINGARNVYSVATYSKDVQLPIAIRETLANEVGVYHFNDTTRRATIQLAGYVEDNRQLHWDGGNLAAFLYRLRVTDTASYQRIVGTIRMVAPFFDDFSLAPRALDPTRILLNWKQIGVDHEFGPHQLSDGTLRVMALIALFLQPTSELPKLIVIDEPEIGLHPYALSVVMSLIRKASHHTQLIVATQSPQLLDECEPEDIICADRQAQETIFQRPDAEKLKEWLTDYSLGEVWQKNIIGGGPH